MKLQSICFLLLCAVSIARADDGAIGILVEGEELVSYQAKPLENPLGGDAFRGSNFLHPLKTPSGFVVTRSEPDDHYHHFGLWWPWKFIEVDERQVLCWELQGGDGLIQAVEHERLDGGIIGRSVYIDRKAPEGPRILLEEECRITTTNVHEKPAYGYFLDIEISQNTTEGRTVVVSPYRYSGFSIRGTEAWDRNNSTILTSEGMDRDGANFSYARWVLIAGSGQDGLNAGVLMMSHPENQAHPEKLRTWDTQHEGQVFVNFNTVGDHGWTLEPGQKYTRKYRLYVFDGDVTSLEAEALWSEYVALPD